MEMEDGLICLLACSPLSKRRRRRRRKMDKAAFEKFPLFFSSPLRAPRSSSLSFSSLFLSFSLSPSARDAVVCFSLRARRELLQQQQGQGRDERYEKEEEERAFDVDARDHQFQKKLIPFRPPLLLPPTPTSSPSRAVVIFFGVIGAAPREKRVLGEAKCEENPFSKKRKRGSGGGSNRRRRRRRRRRVFVSRTRLANANDGIFAAPFLP